MATAIVSEPHDELWKECVTWLTKWEMLRADHKANLPKATITDLANIIRDGVLICKLINKIDPGCIDMKDVNLKPTMAQFLCLRNINLFLKTCELNFGLHRSDLFESSMLFDLTNFHRVLCTLSKLSLSPKAVKGGVPGFSAPRYKSNDEEDLYKSLREIEMPRPRSRELSMGVVDNSEEIYQDLCVHNRLPEQPQTFEKRDFAIRELIDTEKNYVEVLINLREHFMLPLEKYMPPDKHEIIFLKIKELHEIHSHFYQDLLRLEKDSSVKLSSIFMRWKKRFLIYGVYCANLQKATNTLQELCDDSEEFNQIVVKQEKEVNNGRFKLRDVLSVPLQRILKYHLLLQKLIEYTDRNHEEYKELCRAREAMLDVAGYINEAARDKEALDVVNNLQESVHEWQHGANVRLTDYGRLLKDAELKIKDHLDGKTKNRYVFIFEKCILICKQQMKGGFAFRNILKITDYHVEDVKDRPLLNKEARFVYQFLLVKNYNTSVLTVSVRTREIKDQIKKAIDNAIENLRPSALRHTDHPFELYTFSEPQQCLHCSKYLKGLISQGYRCTKCEAAVHKTCIAQSGRCGSTPIVNSDSASYDSLPGQNLSMPNGFGVDDALACRMWYAGEMDRGTANAELEKRENGTFLVRIRIPPDDKDKYAISLKTNNTIKHMKICGTDQSPAKFYLSQSRYFSNIEELVVNYQHFSLRENFEGLSENTKLLWPYREHRGVVVHNFDGSAENHLTLREGWTIRIIGKEGYRDDWWRGRTEDNRVGFFPKECVRDEGECTAETSL